MVANLKNGKCVENQQEFVQDIFFVSCDPFDCRWMEKHPLRVEIWLQIRKTANVLKTNKNLYWTSFLWDGGSYDGRLMEKHPLRVEIWLQIRKTANVLKTNKNFYGTSFLWDGGTYDGRWMEKHPLRVEIWLQIRKIGNVLITNKNLYGTFFLCGVVLLMVGGWKNTHSELKFGCKSEKQQMC